MRSLLMLASLIAPLSTSALAQEPVAPVTCLTPDLVYAEILASVPDVEIESITTEPPYTMTFTSDSMPTNLVVTFDDAGCAVSAKEVGKVKA